MKRAIALILALTLCIGLCACGSKGTKLTLDNYTDYLEISVYTISAKDVEVNDCTFYDYNQGNFACGKMSSYFTLGANVEGLSSNYDYSDITITVKATGKYLVVSKDDTSYKKEPRSEGASIEETIVCELDISGNGAAVSNTKHMAPEGMLIPYHEIARSYDFEYEIISIEGTVSRIN